MSLVQMLCERRSSDSISMYWTRFLELAMGGQETASGEKVNEDGALKLSAFWAAVHIISGAVGFLPLNLYRRLPDDGREKAPTHPAWKLIHDRPNEYQDALTFQEQLQAHVLVYGNGYAQIERDSTGKPLALWPMLPTQVSPALRNGGRTVVYEHVIEGRDPIIHDAANVLHIKGLGFDGLKGYSVIGYARESLGLTQATERFGARFFGNGAVASGVLTHPGKLSDPARKHLIEELEKKHGGEQQHRPMLLQEGMQWAQNTIPPDDAQFLETRKIQITEIARWFQIPPHMLADLEHATFSNIEHQGIQFVTMTLMRWLRAWEHECSWKLLGAPSRKTHFCEFNPAALLRGDTGARYKAYHDGIMDGWLTRNEARQLENLNRIDGLDDPLQPLNMTAVGETPPKDAPPAEPSRFRPLVSETYRRLLHKECQALRKQVTRPAFDAATFYATHRDHMQAVLEPVLRAILGVENPEVAAEYVAKRYTDAHRDRLHTILSNGQARRVDDILTEWETVLPDQLTDEALSYAR